MPDSTLKEEAHALIDRLPDDASWEDIQYQIYVRQAVAAGLKAAEEGRLISAAEVRRQFTKVRA